MVLRVSSYKQYKKFRTVQLVQISQSLRFFFIKRDHHRTLLARLLWQRNIKLFWLTFRILFLSFWSIKPKQSRGRSENLWGLGQSIDNMGKVFDETGSASSNLTKISSPNFRRSYNNCWVGVVISKHLRFFNE